MRHVGGRGGTRWDNGWRGEGGGGNVRKKREEKDYLCIQEHWTVVSPAQLTKTQRKRLMWEIAASRVSWGKQLGTREKVPGWSFWSLGRTQLWPSRLYLHTWRSLETSQSRWRMLMSSNRSLWSFNVHRMKGIIPLCCVLMENNVGCIKKKKAKALKWRPRWEH